MHDTDEIFDAETAYLIANEHASDPALPYHSPFARARARALRTIPGDSTGAGDVSATAAAPGSATWSPPGRPSGAPPTGAERIAEIQAGLEAAEQAGVLGETLGAIAAALLPAGISLVDVLGAGSGRIPGFAVPGAGGRHHGSPEWFPSVDGSMPGQTIPSLSLVSEDDESTTGAKGPRPQPNEARPTQAPTNQSNGGGGFSGGDGDPSPTPAGSGRNENTTEGEQLDTELDEIDRIVREHHEMRVEARQENIREIAESLAEIQVEHVTRQEEDSDEYWRRLHASDTHDPIDPELGGDRSGASLWMLPPWLRQVLSPPAMAWSGGPGGRPDSSAATPASSRPLRSFGIEGAWRPRFDPNPAEAAGLPRSTDIRRAVANINPGPRPPQSGASLTREVAGAILGSIAVRNRL